MLGFWTFRDPSPSRHTDSSVSRTPVWHSASEFGCPFSWSVSLIKAGAFFEWNVIFAILSNGLHHLQSTAYLITFKEIQASSTQLSWCGWPWYTLITGYCCYVLRVGWTNKFPAQTFGLGSLCVNSLTCKGGKRRVHAVDSCSSEA